MIRVPVRLTMFTPGVALALTCQAMAQPLPVDCEPLCPPPAPAPQIEWRTEYEQRVVTRTVMVPETVHQTVQVQEQSFRQEQRTQKVMVPQQVAEVVSVQVPQTVMATETRMVAMSQTEMRPVYRDVQVPVTVAVQGVENRVGVQQVQAVMPVRVQIPVTSQCHCTHAAPGMPSVKTTGQPEQRMLEAVQHQTVVVNQQVTYQVPVTRYETRYQTQRVVEYQPVARSVEVPVQVQVARQVMQTQQQVQYRTVPQEMTQTSTVNVPVTVTREVSVPVTRMVPQTVQETISVPVRRAVVKPVAVCEVPIVCEPLPACPTCQP